MRGGLLGAHWLAGPPCHRLDLTCPRMAVLSPAARDPRFCRISFIVAGMRTTRFRWNFSASVGCLHAWSRPVRGSQLPYKSVAGILLRPEARACSARCHGRSSRTEVISGDSPATNLALGGGRGCLWRAWCFVGALNGVALLLGEPGRRGTLDASATWGSEAVRSCSRRPASSAPGSPVRLPYSFR